MRVRHYGDTARIEVPVAELGARGRGAEAVVAAVRAAGYRYVTLDLDGLAPATSTGPWPVGPYQRSVPTPPLNGPTTAEVIQPP